jgi:hypothetical protein
MSERTRELMDAVVRAVIGASLIAFAVPFAVYADQVGPPRSIVLRERMPRELFLDVFVGAGAVLLLDATGTWISGRIIPFRKAAGAVLFASSFTFQGVNLLGVLTEPAAQRLHLTVCAVLAIFGEAAGAFCAVVGEWPCTARQFGRTAGGAALAIFGVAIAASPGPKTPKVALFGGINLMGLALLAGPGLAMAVDSFGLWVPARATAARRAAGFVVAASGLIVIAMAVTAATGRLGPDAAPVLVMSLLAAVVTCVGLLTAHVGKWPWN